ncbi:Fic family protein [Anaerotignum sp.]|uniref:Fic family protein n=1 Tax=Anaerotignum sp. TaxID=2039241 RepID=UPI0028B15CDE|nr:Fic family protein [Anaerotignum sp.]
MKLEEIIKKQQQYADFVNKINIDVKENHEQAFEIEYAHNSTAIEGNTLTLIETKVLLEDALSIGGKKLREIYEVVNHQKAFEYVKKCVSEGLPLTEKITKDIHALVNENILIGGVYRSEPVSITGAKHKPPVGQKMFEQIKNFFMDLPYKNEMNPLELAAWTHAEFVRIHPFIDGNGRTSRLIMNYQLMLCGYPPVSIPVADKLHYYECLEAYAVTGDIKPFADMLGVLVSQRLDEYLEIIQSIKMNASDFEQKMI